MIGRTISHYRIAAQLGAGGMGVVYRAEDLRLGRDVALKFVSDDLMHDEQAVRRLRAEARAASALNHANICTIYDIDEVDGHPFIVMELMKGRTLRDALAAGALRIHQIVDVGIETADALQAAHSQGIVHRDIKPGNIFVTERNHVKILDFGLTKLTGNAADAGSTVSTEDNTMAGITLGTVHYMSPEQATGEDLDGRTDLFSLGVVLYECATGRHPFPGKTSAVILEAILNRAPLAPVTLNPELPVRLQEVINNCLEKDRELRYQSAADLRADLKRVRRDLESGRSQAVEAVTARGTSHPAGRTTVAGGQPVAEGRADAAARRSRRMRLAVALVLAASVLGIAWYAFSRRAPGPPAHDAGRIAPASDAALQSRLALARSSLEARSYRAALAYALDVLAIDPNQASAAGIRDQARTMLDRFDAAVADARQDLADGDVRAAARSLDTARGIDPTAPTVSELSVRLAEQVRRKDADVPPAPKSRPSITPPAAMPRPQPAAPAPAAGSSARTEPASPPPAAVPPPPRVQSPSAEPPPPAAATPAPVPAAPPEPAPPKPSPPPSAAVERRDPETPPSVEDDDAAIRKVVAAYARAIENKDMALFRSIKPNLSGEEERRLQAGFRAVATQRVAVTILSIQPRGDQASVVLRRRDTIEVDRRQQTADSQQTVTVARARGGWVIVDIR